MANKSSVDSRGCSCCNLEELSYADSGNLTDPAAVCEFPLLFHKTLEEQKDFPVWQLVMQSDASGGDVIAQ